MDLQIQHDNTRHMMIALDDKGKPMGRIEYEPVGTGELRATHTLVLPEYEGKGIAGSLLGALVDYARESGAAITPVCSYVAAAFQKNPERYADVSK